MDADLSNDHGALRDGAGGGAVDTAIAIGALTSDSAVIRACLDQGS